MVLRRGASNATALRAVIGAIAVGAGIALPVGVAHGVFAHGGVSSRAELLHVSGAARGTGEMFTIGSLPTGGMGLTFERPLITDVAVSAAHAAEVGAAAGHSTVEQAVLAIVHTNHHLFDGRLLWVVMLTPRQGFWYSTTGQKVRDRFLVAFVDPASGQSVGTIVAGAPA
jgi:hypothetical protein